jgi:hypothetical protein
MRDRMNTHESTHESGAPPGATPLPHGSVDAQHAADQARLKELETANARLLKLVGELLVVNQQLRERSAS